MRIKVQTLKTLLWLGNAAVGIAIAVLLMTIVVARKKGTLNEHVAKATLEKQINARPTIQASERKAAIDWSLLENLHSLNVTGKEPPKPPDPEETNKGPTGPVPPIDTVLLVMNLTASSDPALGTARIHYLADGPPGSTPPAPPPPTIDPKVRATPILYPNYVVVGSALRDPYDKAPYNAKVIAITEEGVKLQWGEKEELVKVRELANPVVTKLMPGLDGMPNPPANNSASTPQPAQPVTPVAAPAESRQLNANDWFIGTTEREMITEKHDELLKDITFTSTMSKSENRLRVKIATVKENSLAWQRGFREDDVVRKVNGEEVSSKSTLINYIKTHPRLSLYKIEVERKGSVLTKSFQLSP